MKKIFCLTIMLLVLNSCSSDKKTKLPFLNLDKVNSTDISFDSIPEVVKKCFYAFYTYKIVVRKNGDTISSYANSDYSFVCLDPNAGDSRTNIIFEKHSAWIPDYTEYIIGEKYMLTSKTLREPIIIKDKKIYSGVNFVEVQPALIHRGCLVEIRDVSNFLKY